MTKDEPETVRRSVISASWERCERKHRLARNTVHPILRLQAAEIRPRSELLVERTGGRLGIFRQIADIAVRAGHCFSVADADGILVRCEGKAVEQSDYESNGISLGSCWDERIAGTNGVSMAMAGVRPFTVRGHEHYFSKFAPFACTGATLHDAVNQKIGVVNLAIVDRGNAADYLFAQLLLGAAAERIQRILFERYFCDKMLVAVSPETAVDALRGSELVAVDESGLILGSTTAAHRLIGLAGPMGLTGQSFEDLFGTDAFALDRAPERAPNVQTGDGTVVRLSRHLKDRNSYPGQGWRPPAPVVRHTAEARPISLQELSSGSTAIAALCARAQAYLKLGLPFIVQGESGSGKTALIAALNGFAERTPRQTVTVDCAVLGENERDRAYLDTILEQARIVGMLGSADPRPLSLIFDNIHEMPGFAQAVLRGYLQERETKRDVADASAPRPGAVVIATTCKPLVRAVRAGEFREDLFYLLANTIIALPRLQTHERLDVLVRSLAARVAGGPVHITTEAMAAIQSFDWPGNVRELRNVLQQAILEGNGCRISLMDLKASTMFDQRAREATTIGPGRQRIHDLTYSEKNEILDALIGARWNVSLAARKLGIARATIHRKMNKFDISRPS